jgi:5-formyltetrahydrofolate cyclo-ligase
VEKKQLRRQLRALPPVTVEINKLVVDHLFGWLSRRVPGTITSFLAMTGEIDLRPLFDRLPGWRWLLPRVEEDRTLTWRDARVPLERHPFGMEQPTATGPVVPIHEIDLFLVPGLGFDPCGRRLGQGAGFYDRELAGRRSDAVAVGVTVDARVLVEIPFEDHDQRVHFLATESGVIASTPTK